MHYSTKQFGLFTFSIIIILHLYLFKDEIKLYFIKLYNNQLIILFNIYNNLINDSMIIIYITIISSILLIGLIIYWILYNQLLFIKLIIKKILMKLKLLNYQNKHKKIE
ncbi:unnamed protein product [Schistosoma rodhaini]|uniref:Uncharacterized protein n=1 Tax=Schistosoma rodhaini TaxID=6188 RepID=A0AA85GFG1_9TREM|nr:unnamed protein product [Schistosoma rodhaini]